MVELEILIISCAPFTFLETCLGSVVCAQQEAKRSDLIRVLLQGDVNNQQLERLRKTFSSVSFEIQKDIFRPGKARNILLQSAKASAVHFIDEDVELPEGFYLSLQLELEAHPKAIALGGPDLGMKNQSPFQTLVSLVIGSYFGTGPSCWRYSKRSKIVAQETQLTTTSVVLRGKDILSKKFPEMWVAGEESVFLSEVGRMGEMIYSPKLFVRHHRRANLMAFAKQFIRYGKGRGYCLRRGRPWKVLHLVPLMSPAVLFLWPIHILSAYFILEIIFVVEIALREKNKNIWQLLYCFMLFPFLHFCYLLGMLRGISSTEKTISG